MRSCLIKCPSIILVHKETDTGASSADHLRQGPLRDLGNVLFRLARLAEFRQHPSLYRRPSCTIFEPKLTYSGPLLADVLARVGLKASRETEPLILHSSLIATGTDHYFVLYSVAEVEPSFNEYA